MNKCMYRWPADTAAGPRNTELGTPCALPLSSGRFQGSRRADLRTVLNGDADRARRPPLPYLELGIANTEESWLLR